ncbi:glycosyltransferase [Halocatena pleomorpha]|uniref:Glycosyltransferase family 4 protein n=1 Tax=Halocatena pleomorpha TaxID=1785090 RepID=A0A3P3RA10_9EURY|nr:glycosyltransferase [Halocatena pleomorpha]RRJ30327.1 glycosyltransferase family 4 protein [Halocatena pleomorpha]
MRPTVAAFTDTYLPTVNGVTYTVKAWRDHWHNRGGRMEIVYPKSKHTPQQGEHPVSSLPFPFYEGFRMGFPRIPDAVHEADIDIVHAHTPFGVGLSGLRVANRADLPVVMSYHTPAEEYATYLTGALSKRLVNAAAAYEEWFLDRADHIITPSKSTRDRLESRVDGPITVIPNGIDTDRFAPVDTEEFRDRFGLPDGPLVGYTGRHGYEKRLCDILDATEELDVTVVFGGDGPARSKLEARAATVDTDVRFLGFLDREDLPAFYSTLDVFAFPSPVETEGLVALEANACGTPVVGINAGALAETITAGKTGYHFEPEDIAGFRQAIQRALAENETLVDTCLARRTKIGVDSSLDQLETVYESVG